MGTLFLCKEQISIAICFIIPIFRDDEIKRLSMPVALFVGGKDIMLHSYKTADRLHKLLPHSQINVLPREGHSVTRLSAEIMSFLKGD
jgi:pimeloyl-ACP methyl ester carboxylesterase